MKASNLLYLPAIALFVAWFVFLRPVGLGGPVSYVQVNGTSMEPTLRNGDLALVHKQRSYGKGDVVAFRVAGGVVIHRIVDVTSDGFVTQGTNSNGTDPWQPSVDDVVGRMWFSIPRAGRLLAAFQAPLVLAGLASAVAVFLVLSGAEERKMNRRPLPPASRADGAHRRFPTWHKPGLRFLLVLVLPAVALAAYKSGKRL